MISFTDLSWGTSKKKAIFFLSAFFAALPHPLSINQLLVQWLLRTGLASFQETDKTVCKKCYPCKAAQTRSTTRNTNSVFIVRLHSRNLARLKGFLLSFCALGENEGGSLLEHFPCTPPFCRPKYLWHSSCPVCWSPACLPRSPHISIITKRERERPINC